ncbi:MerR family transcriptional regulator [Xylocopilactobacillus apicola]|uniref:Transcriptional regulator n=1 Tax=Xylocopilactobacillus apicola TaxID=2932184 RepID=A0AAU9D3N2_9LACO|nr:MerR family transcriptional regulator [Xylocopilactobacillus apicola]BDR58063.1 transcriptional regulator [Xylocopilactobacillus apicola]
MNYEIGEFAAKVGLTIDTLRYYESVGIIAPARLSNGHRSFNDEDIAWVEFVKRLKETGMPIKNIKAYSDLRRVGDSTIDERLELLAEQQNLLKEQQAKTQAHLDFLAHKIEYYQELKNNS